MSQTRGHRNQWMPLKRVQFFVVTLTSLPQRLGTFPFFSLDYNKKSVGSLLALFDEVYLIGTFYRYFWFPSCCVFLFWRSRVIVLILLSYRLRVNTWLTSMSKKVSYLNTLLFVQFGICDYLIYSNHCFTTVETIDHNERYMSHTHFM